MSPLLTLGTIIAVVMGAMGIYVHYRDYRESTEEEANDDDKRPLPPNP